MRRAFLERVALIAAAVAPIRVLAAPAEDAAARPSNAGVTRVVYHIGDGTQQATHALGNIRNHLRADPTARIVVVALSEGIRLLLHGEKDGFGRPFADQVTALSKTGVQFRICENTLHAHQVAMDRVLPEAQPVPAGVAELARLQCQEGYAYIRP